MSDLKVGRGLGAIFIEPARGGPGFATSRGHKGENKLRWARVMQAQTVLFRFTGPMGVRVEVAQSLLILLGFLLWMNIGGDPVFAVMLPVLLLAAIFAHELGHAWGNLVQGLPVEKVVLHGGGGYCQAARAGTPYQQELVVAMGPIVNLGLWAVCSLVAHWTPIYWTAAAIDPGRLAAETLYYVWFFGQINILLFCLNMIPVQPLDGGKLLHLMLLRLMPADAAQSLAGAVGLVCAVLWIPAMVALYIWVGLILLFLP